MEPIIEAGAVTKLGNFDVSGILGSDIISAATPRVAKHPGVRQVVSDIQQEYATHHGAVMEGRAIGTAVMPDADIKVYLTCDPQERVRRRKQDGNNETIEELLERDRLDSERENAPLRKPDDAIEIDTTSLTTDEVVNMIVGMAKKITSSSDEPENL
ncbi:MAG: cytidylate kinase [Patescibacteria group bacterium]|nr:cytidylate kinase [Patescibacteria group bacterium]